MKDHPALAEYLAFVEPERTPLLRAIDAAVWSSGEPLEAAVKYRLLLYTVDRRYHDWICAIGPTKRTISLRFLHGDRMDFGSIEARPGSTTMRTIDYTSVDQVDADAIAGLVRQAVALHPSKG